MKIKLTPTQQKILNHAHAHSNGEIRWFPPTLAAGPRKTAIQALTSRGLVEARGADLVISAKGYRAIGVTASAPVRIEPTPALAKPPSISKQAALIGLMRRPEGATLAQLCEATGWRAHTVRGAIAGTVKKRLGLVVTSVKPQDSQRVYRVM
jgi:hypothetical protein